MNYRYLITRSIIATLVLLCLFMVLPAQTALAYSTNPICNDAQPNTIYVNSSVVGGSNDGTTYANAFLTIQAAVNAASPGNIICVSNGTYAGVTISQQVTLVGPNYDTSPNSAADITVAAARATEANLTGSFTIAANNVEINGFSSTAGVGITQAAANRFNNITISNNVFNGNNFAININLNNSLPRNDFMLIENNRITNYAGGSQTGIWVHQVNNLTIQNNYINSGVQNNSRGINLGGNTGVLVANNHIEIPLPQTAGFGIQVGADYPGGMNNIVVEDNTIIGSTIGISLYPCDATSPPTPPTGSNLENITLRGNEITNVDGSAIRMGLVTVTLIVGTAR